MYVIKEQINHKVNGVDIPAYQWKIHLFHSDLYEKERDRFYYNPYNPHSSQSYSVIISDMWVIGSDYFLLWPFALTVYYGNASH